MALLVLMLWLGSAVAGWFLFWPWLSVPVVVIGIHIMRVMARMKAVARRNGMSSSALAGSMTSANTRLLVGTLIQHAVIFGVVAFVHYLVG
ncbi:hypothetical protein [Novosphingobium decolorationis]|uniref:Uncharacterized protein n=1 Tax=Novosphingobium decolorationis TaxID=2698673 RepID=A0ABX8E1G2_9SPHN|nr:hypothetical protein [Novosphingobium decolorationis]QVM82966.1 hypothetical protein HT578_03895 [Novosphingobium decolorationis]